MLDDLPVFHGIVDVAAGVDVGIYDDALVRLDGFIDRFPAFLLFCLKGGAEALVDIVSVLRSF